MRVHFGDNGAVGEHTPGQLATTVKDTAGDEPISAKVVGQNPTSLTARAATMSTYCLDENTTSSYTQEEWNTGSGIRPHIPLLLSIHFQWSKSTAVG